MSYQEKENVVNIFSSILIAIIYSLIIYNKHQSGIFDLTDDYKSWGIVFLIFVGVSIVSRIIIYIIFHIINAIATREMDTPVSDERDKLIKLKATRNGYHVFSGSIMLVFVYLALDKPLWGIFIIFVIGGVLSEIVDNVSQIHYHRRGV